MTIMTNVATNLRRDLFSQNRWTETPQTLPPAWRHGEIMHHFQQVRVTYIGVAQSHHSYVLTVGFRYDRSWKWRLTMHSCVECTPMDWINTRRAPITGVCWLFQHHYNWDKQQHKLTTQSHWRLRLLNVVHLTFFTLLTRSCNFA